MNEENFEYLSNNLKYLGFGEDLNTALRVELEKQESIFQLYHKASFGNDEAEAILHFRKSNINDMYFFEKYHLHLLLSTRAEELFQPFYIYKGKGITLKEGYNLLCGRSVNKDLTNKDGQLYNAWLQLDMSAKENESYKIRQYHQNYGFDLERTLESLPIKELIDKGDREKLIRSLEKGNLQPVCFLKEGRERKMYIEANPRFKSINVFDGNMMLIKEYSRLIQSQEQKNAEDQKSRTEKAAVTGIRQEEKESEGTKRKRISI